MAAAAQAAAPPASVLAFDIAYDPAVGEPLYNARCAACHGGALDAAGPVIAGGMLYVHSGYWGRTGPGSVLLAFSVDGR